ncbi:properdin-like isoform X1 [Clavelina lepadiformis]|uniref:properdin-like isoform X1 n=1 Tax=Clavelina lepadiformis TaxID=159417 RepID=UPI004043251C
MKGTVASALCFLMAVQSCIGCHTYITVRRKRQAEESTEPEAEVERTRFLRDYFTACLEDVIDPTAIGSDLDWRSNVDFSVLDSVWYDNTANLDCGFGQTEDCWKDILIRFLEPSSALLPFVRRCIDDYAVDVRRNDDVLQHTLQLARKRRQAVSDIGENGYSSCLGGSVIHEEMERDDLDFDRLADFIRLHTANQTCRTTENIPDRSWPSRFVVLTRTDSNLRRSLRVCGQRFFPQDFPSPRPPGRSGQDDASWAVWAVWSSCSSTCGGGIRDRERMCLYRGREDSPLPPSLCLCYLESLGRIIDEDDKQEEPCNTDTCDAPENFSWTPWLSYSACTATSCGTRGTQARTRNCVNEGGNNVSARFCEGESTEVRICNAPPCLPTVAYWGQWSTYTPCSFICGSNGTQTRKRDCLVGETVASASLCDRNQVGDISEESRTCPGSPCPAWRVWSSYGACSVTCGEGTQSRTRRCIDPAINQELNPSSCEGLSTERRTCRGRPCLPTGANWGQWSLFTVCSVTCGPGGTQTRERVCSINGQNIVRPSLCPGIPSQDRSCNGPPCGPAAAWGQWGPYSTCSVTCGRGTQIRTRQCIDPSTGRALNPINCDRDGRSGSLPCVFPPCSIVQKRYSPWTPWGLCTRTCGPDATRIRHRCVLTSANRCGEVEREVESCQDVALFCFE